MPNFIDITGKKYHRWAVKKRAENDKINQVCWLCVCDCGTVRVVTGTSLKSGGSKSCGCLRKDTLPHGTRLRHGQSHTKIHRTWCAIRHRCSNPNNHAWGRYGGRGIKVCARWQVFENFLEDMGHPPKGATLDRINNDGPYSPENCRWATMKEQQNNRGNNRKSHYRGQAHTFSVWSKKLGIKRSTLSQRFYGLGWSATKTLSTPVQKRS